MKRLILIISIIFFVSCSNVYAYTKTDLIEKIKSNKYVPDTYDVLIERYINQNEFNEETINYIISKIDDCLDIIDYKDLNKLSIKDKTSLIKLLLSTSIKTNIKVSYDSKYLSIYNIDGSLFVKLDNHIIRNTDSNIKGDINIKHFIKFIILVSSIYFIYNYISSNNKVIYTSNEITIPSFGNYLGSFSIDSINLHTDIIDGDLEYLLNNNIGHYFGSHYPNENGLVLLSGHNDILKDLKLVEIDDRLDIIINNILYNYIVYDKELISNEELEKKIDFSKDGLIIYTCSNNQGKKLVIYAKNLF